MEAEIAVSTRHPADRRRRGALTLPVTDGKMRFIPFQRGDGGEMDGTAAFKLTKCATSGG